MTVQTGKLADPASFRDPAGCIIWQDGCLLRTVNDCYRISYDQFVASGLAHELIKDGLIIDYEDITDANPLSPNRYKLLKPEVISFISYPYEWCFSQLRDAALLTLELHKRALARDMALKDASAFNIQFCSGNKPIHIDTLSFEPYVQGQPWRAYRQFCQHFLAPLALMAFRDVSIIKLMANFPDGIPLSRAAGLLGTAWIRRPSLFMHLILHSRLEEKVAGASDKPRRSITKMAQIHMADHLQKLISSLPVPSTYSHWKHYKMELPYNPDEAKKKNDLIAHYCEIWRPKTVWDIGANAGKFSFIAAAVAEKTVAIEADHAMVEICYASVQQSAAHVLPLWVDILSPSPMLGWAHSERRSLAARGKADLLLCLAVSHHLAIAGNVPFSKQAEYFATITEQLLIEFIQPGDPNAQRMLQAQPELKIQYNESCFEKAFLKYFVLDEKHCIIPDRRTLYALKRKTA